MLGKLTDFFVKKQTLLLFAILVSQSLQAEMYKPQKSSTYLILDNPNYGQNGLFSMFTMVLGILQDFERGKLAGCEINFGTEGFYYDPTIGPNWWEYYFEPVKVGSKYRTNGRKTTLKERNHFAVLSEFHTSKYKNNTYIEKYIRLKPHIDAKIREFEGIYFANQWMIGVHYRGTDKVAEAPRITYNEVSEQINKVIEQREDSSYAIFVATDEQAFLEYMKVRFPGKVVFLEDGIRSTTGQAVHSGEQELNYKKGEDAVLDCVLLSHCDILLRTSSNLSLISTFFSPDMPVIELTKRY